MKQLVRERYLGCVCRFAWGLHRCRRRFGIAMRTKSNCKRAAAIDRIPAVRQWLARYRAMLSTPLAANGPHLESITPALRFNCDQVCSAFPAYVLCFISGLFLVYFWFISGSGYLWRVRCRWPL